MRSLPVPTSINIFKLDPLRGNAILVVDSRLVFAMDAGVSGLAVVSAICSAPDPRAAAQVLRRIAGAKR